MFSYGIGRDFRTPSSDSVPSHNFNQAFDALSADSHLLFFTMGFRQYLAHSEESRKILKEYMNALFLEASSLYYIYTGLP